MDYRALLDHKVLLVAVDWMVSLDAKEKLVVQVLSVLQVPVV